MTAKQAMLLAQLGKRFSGLDLQFRTKGWNTPGNPQWRVMLISNKHEQYRITVHHNDLLEALKMLVKEVEQLDATPNDHDP